MSSVCTPTRDISYIQACERVGVCEGMCGYVREYVGVYGSVWECVGVCGSV